MTHTTQGGGVTQFGQVSKAIGLAAILVGVAGQAASAQQDAMAPIENNRLYLRTGVVDTSLPVEQLAVAARGMEPGARWVIQLDGPMTPVRRQKLEAAGLVIGEYLPKDAYVVSMRGADADAIEALVFVQWNAPYAAEWKLDPEIGVRAYSAAERIGETAKGLVTVHITLFQGEPNAEPTLQKLREIPGAVTHFVEDAQGAWLVSATLPFNDTIMLADVEQVMFVEDAPDNTLRSNTNNRWIVQSNVSGVTPLYANGLLGQNQIAAILDGRIDVNHCSFSDTNPIGPTHRKILAYNASLGADSHGTHVAGTTAGDSGLFDDKRGIAYMAKLVYNTVAVQDEAGVTQRLNLHYSQGARIHSNSWGDDDTTAYTGQCRGIDAHVYANEDSLVLFAVTNTSTLRTPENAKNLLAVGATQGAPNQANHCSGGVGPTNDGRRKPEIYAPGCSTVSSSSNSGCGTVAFTGTSMACPAVAGTATLVRQYFTDGYYPTGVATPSDAIMPTAALLKATLLDSTVDMTGVAGYPSNLEGWGRVLADNALFFPGDARRLIVQDIRNANGMSTGNTIDYGVNVSAGQPLEVTLVWTEPAAAANAGFASINDLDLEVVAPGGATYLGNVFTGGVSSTGGSRDIRNNVEKVLLAAPTAGAYIVRVKGTAVNVGTQGYALVVTGDVFAGPRPLSISLDTTPAQIAPGSSLPVTATISLGDDTLTAGSATLLYRYDAGAFNSVSLTPLGGDSWGATLPLVDCDDVPQFYVEASGDTTGLVQSPSGGAAAPRTAVVGVTTIALFDDMETDMGWTVGALGDTATTGIWVRGDPVGTQAQPEDDHTPSPGVNAWVTGQGLVGGAAGTNDIDGGATSLTSPVFDASALSNPTISYWRWFSDSSGSVGAGDTFIVTISNNGGTTWFPVETAQAGSPGVGGGWYQHSFQPTTILPLTSTMRMRFSAGDFGTASIVEAALDDVEVQEFGCVSVTPPCCLGNSDKTAPGAVDFDDITSVLSNWGAGYGVTGPGDGNCDGNVDFDDITAVLSNWGSACK